MKITNEIHRCTGCHACASICPKKCIQMIQDNDGFLYPSIDESNCIECGLCSSVCPVNNSEPLLDEIDTKAYAAKNLDASVRQKSSSGGAFTALAEYILENGGVVFGAAFNDELEVVHVSIDKKEDLWKLRGSKYVQSKIDESYIRTQKLLKQGTLVLFTGTPCQIVGLKNYLTKDYPNLYTQDIVCHGVPSPLVLKTYINNLEKKYKSSISSFNFRDKTTGWKSYSVSIKFSNGEIHTEKFKSNSYMTAFLDNLALRRSCYECSAKGIQRAADITLADFWGVETIYPGSDDDSGTSLVIVHSKKGEFLFNEASAALDISNVSLVDSLQFNTSAIQSSKMPKARETFIKEIRRRPFDRVVNKYTAPKILARIKTFIKKALS